MYYHAEKSRTQELTQIAIIAALYVVLTLFTAPISLGSFQFRLAEGLNFLALYHKRYIPAMTLGVFITNYFAYGLWDKVVGSISTFIFLHLGVWLAETLAGLLRKTGFTGNLMVVKYAVLNTVFALSMFTIALLVKFLGSNLGFWTLYLSLAVTEFISMGLGGFILYQVAKRIDLR